ncbi:MAG: hypothetical protein EST26_02040 [Hydrogenophaga sp.]|nr:hypothetical protein [Hydrogenophaga sp.]
MNEACRAWGQVFVMTMAAYNLVRMRTLGQFRLERAQCVPKAGKRPFEREKQPLGWRFARPRRTQSTETGSSDRPRRPRDPALL